MRTTTKHATNTDYPTAASKTAHHHDQCENDETKAEASSPQSHNQDAASHGTCPPAIANVGLVRGLPDACCVDRTLGISAEGPEFHGADPVLKIETEHSQRLLTMSNVLTLSPNRANCARAISDLSCPPVMAVPALAVGAWASRGPGTYWYAMIYYGIAVFVPVLYVIWAVRAGRISDFHMANRRERVAPFAVSLVCGLSAWVLLAAIGTPRDFRCTGVSDALADAAAVF